MKEAQIQEQVIKLLKRRGAWVIKTQPTDGVPVGTPDVLACYAGRFIALEIKQPKRYARRAQKYQIQQIKNAGGVAEVIRSEAELVVLLNSLGNS